MNDIKYIFRALAHQLCHYLHHLVSYFVNSDFFGALRAPNRHILFWAKRSAVNLQAKLVWWVLLKYSTEILSRYSLFNNLSLPPRVAFWPPANEMSGS